MNKLFLFFFGFFSACFCFDLCGGIVRIKSRLATERRIPVCYPNRLITKTFRFLILVPCATFIKVTMRDPYLI